MAEPSFPPVYQPDAVAEGADPFDRARDAAAHGAVDGALYWSRREDRMDCALVLAPDEPLAATLAVAPVAMVALSDALGALVPPAVAVMFGWPDRLLVNGGLAGGLRVAWPDGADVPPWLVLGASVAVAADPNEEAGHRPGRTALHEEGCGEVSATMLLEAFARHLLSWMHRWQEDGFAPVRESMLGRTDGWRQPMALELAGRRHAGVLHGLDDQGGLILANGARRTVLPLAEALRAPSWRL